MQAIMNLVSTPEWWFSAIFVAIVTGVVATYAQNWISAALSALSKHLRARIIRKKEERRIRVALMVARPVLLSIAYQRATYFLVGWIFLVVVALGYPTAAGLFSRFPDADPFRVWVVPGVHPSYLAFAVSSLALIASLVVQARLMDLLSDCTKARKELIAKTTDAMFGTS